MASCDVNTLLSQAGCFSCLDAETREILRLQLLCAISSGVISGSGTINTLPKFTAAKVLGDSKITDDGTTVTVGALLSVSASANAAAVTVSGYSLTGNNAQSLLDLSGTWNTTGTPSGIKLNISDTASNAASNLLDLQVGSAKKYVVQKDGTITTSLGFNTGALLTLQTSGFDIRMRPSAGGNFITFQATTSHILPNTSASIDVGGSGTTFRNAFFSGVVTTGTAGSIGASSVTLTNAAGVAAGTITNAPTAGNPTKWIQYNDNGTTLKIPAWT